MKNNLINIGKFLGYLFIAWSTDTVLLSARQELLSGNYLSLHYNAWGMYFLFSCATIAFFWHGIERNETAIFTNLVIALISSIAIYSISFIPIDIGTISPFRFFFKQIGRIGLGSAYFLAYHFSLALSILNLSRQYWKSFRLSRRKRD